MINVLLRIARQVVQNVLSQLTQLFDMIQEQAYSPMQAMVQQVMDGVWVGKGADAFVDEVTNLMMPGVGKIGEGVNTYSRNIQNAMDVMDRADEQVSGIVNALGDIFDGIF